MSHPVERIVGGGIISRGGAHGPSTYTGGHFLWPVVGGGNYISQYFHYGHYAIDIAADYGSEVRAAGAGTVVFAGWKGNGGGYQVWISHGSNLYTTYNHMSAISVGYGQSVVGRPAGRPDRAIGRRHRPAPPFRGLARSGLERRQPGQPARLPVGPPPGAPDPRVARRVRSLTHAAVRSLPLLVGAFGSDVADGGRVSAVREWVRCSSTA